MVLNEVSHSVVLPVTTSYTHDRGRSTDLHATGYFTNQIFAAAAAAATC